MFLWYHGPVVVEVTLGHRQHVCHSSLFSEPVACWETLHHQRGACDESMQHVWCWGAQTLRHIRQLLCYHSTAAAPKTKIIFHQDEVTTAKACAVGVQNITALVGTLQTCTRQILKT